MTAEDPTKVFLARAERTTVLKLVGELRFTNAQTLRPLLDEALTGLADEALIVDVTELRKIDSTGLGLLARIGNLASARGGQRLTILCPEGDLAFCLRAAAFDEVFDLVEALPADPVLSRFVELPVAEQSAAAECSLGRVVLEAHRELMAVSETNRRAFRGLVEALQAELDEEVGTTGC